jgi:hypothetical protein
MAGAAVPEKRVSYGRLLWVGPLAIVTAVLANALVRTLAVAIVPETASFPPLAFGQFIFLTVAGVLGAVIAFAVVGLVSKRPARTFTIVAIVALALSWLPDIGLLIARPFPGISAYSVGVLMLMHVVAAVISVGLLTRLAVRGEV